MLKKLLKIENVTIAGCVLMTTLASGFERRPIQVLIDQPPLTLDPRFAVDASSQRLIPLIFRGLVSLNADLKPVGDAAQRFYWKGKSLVFELNPGAITPQQWLECAESTRQWPAGAIASAIPHWKGSRLEEPNKLVLEFAHPDPYAIHNLVLLRFFKEEGHICPSGERSKVSALEQTGDYRARPLQDSSSAYDLHRGVRLVPVEKSKPEIRLRYASDDSAKIAALLRGDADAALSSIAISKTEWLRTHAAEDFTLVDRPGVSLTYVAFNLQDPVLKDKGLRQKLAAAIPARAFHEARYKQYAGFTLSLIPPFLEESAQGLAAPPLNTEILEPRLALTLKVGPYRDTIELARVIQEAWRPLGVDLKIEVIEAAVLLTQLRTGKFQMSLSRWVGITDGSILYRTLRTGQKLNRARYSNPQVDGWLDEAVTTLDLTRRQALLAQVQRRMLVDLPYFPLFTWTQTLVLRRKAFEGAAPQTGDLSRSGAYSSLTRLVSIPMGEGVD